MSLSSGIEPIFSWKTHHKLVDLEYDEEHEAYTERTLLFDSKLPKWMKTANEISWDWHLSMQAAFQKHVDNSISKTINLANTATKEDVDKIYSSAWASGLKGITIYRDNCKENQPLNKIENPLAKIGNFADGGTIGINESLLAGLNYGMPTASRLPNNSWANYTSIKLWGRSIGHGQCDGSQPVGLQRFRATNWANNCRIFIKSVSQN